MAPYLGHVGIEVYSRIATESQHADGQSTPLRVRVILNGDIAKPDTSLPASNSKRPIGLAPDEDGGFDFDSFCDLAF